MSTEKSIPKQPNRKFRAWADATQSETVRLCAVLTAHRDTSYLLEHLEDPEGYWKAVAGTVHWTARLDFLDDGFCQDDSTEGVLRSRYVVGDLGQICRVLKADAERLGIRLGSRGGTVDPTVYAEGDREDLQMEANRQAVALGWKPTYRITENEAQL